MPKVEVFVGVTISNEEGTQEKHSLSGVMNDTDSPTKAVAATGMKVIKQILTEMKEGT